MGHSLIYSTTTYRHIKIVNKFQNAKGKRTDQASDAQQGTGRAHRGQEGRETLKTRGCQENLGLPQRKEAPGSCQQAAHLWEGEGPCFRHGEAPETPPDQLDEQPRVDGDRPETHHSTNMTTDEY